MNLNKFICIFYPLQFITKKYSSFTPFEFCKRILWNKSIGHDVLYSCFGVSNMKAPPNPVPLKNSSRGRFLDRLHCEKWRRPGKLFLLVVDKSFMDLTFPGCWGYY